MAHKRAQMVLVILGVLLGLNVEPADAAASRGPAVAVRATNQQLAHALGSVQRWGVANSAVFAGVWLVDDQAFLGVTATDNPRVREAVTAFDYPNQLTLVHASVPLSRLASVQASVDSSRAQLANLGGSLVSTGIDVPGNRVTVGLATLTDGAVGVLHQQFGSLVSVVEQHAQPALSIAPGGGEIDGQGYRCTAAFDLYDGGLLTAGHCFDLNATVSRNGAPIGTVNFRVLGSAFQAQRADVEVVKFPSSLAPTDNVLLGDHCSGCSVPVTGIDTTMVVGQYLCHIGDTSGTGCGAINDNNYSLCYDGSQCYSGLVTVSGDDYCPGDSGGPVFYGQLAKGIISRRYWTGNQPACGQANGILSPLSGVANYIDLSRIRVN